MNKKNLEIAKGIYNSHWIILGIIIIAAILRIWGINEWSMWADEETTVYFSQNLNKYFPKAIPVYFTLLHWMYAVFGVSVGLGRGLAGLFGVLTIGLLYIMVRKYFSRSCALIAAFLLSINLGHIFWSQCVRYYTTVCFFQVVSMFFFLEGFEKRNYWFLFFSNVALAVALLSHYSAIFLVPVYICYLFLILLRKDKIGAYNIKGYFIYGLTLFLIVFFFAQRMFSMRNLLSSWTIPSARDPVHIIKTLVAYFGIPVVVLTFFGLFLRETWTKRVSLYFAILAVIPTLELVIIAMLNIINVTWYYILFAVIGYVVLSARFIVILYRIGKRRISVWLFILTVTYYVLFLILYYSVMHGDRPRWREAAYFVKEAGIIDVNSMKNPEVIANVPGVVAYYLGVGPDKTMGHSLVHGIPNEPPKEKPQIDQWYIIKERGINPEYLAWFGNNCVKEARFKAGTIFRNRSLVVYHYKVNKKRVNKLIE